MKFTFSLAALLLGVSSLINAQDISPAFSRHSVGFISGYGGQMATNRVYRYEVLFLQAQYYYALLRKKTWYVGLLAQPQYNRTKYRPVDSKPAIAYGHEAGLNIGVLGKKNLLKGRIGIYILLSSGPHYVSGVPKRQVSGFIFSDNILAGVHIKIIDRLYLDIRFGFRHISNASLKQPNGGIDTTVLSGGVFFALY